MVCRRLALASRFVAAGFSDGSVMVFHSGGSRDCIFSVKPTHEIIIGPHSRAISGLFIEEGELNQVVFASMDGSLFEGVITARGIAAAGERGGGYRRLMVGNYVNDGILVDFTGDSDRWVGLYVGVNGRSLHIWDASTHDLIFNGGNMTDPDAYHGWHLLVDNVNQYIGRVEIVSHANKVLVVATRSRLCVMDMEHFTVLFDTPPASS